jgi:hypothetical protein
MEVSALITGAGGQPSLTTLQVWKCLHSSQEPAVNHHSPLYRYGSVFTLSTITHHSTGMEVSALIKGASGQPSLTADHSTGMEIYSTITHHSTQWPAITQHSTGMEVYNTVTHHNTQRSAITHHSTGMKVYIIVTHHMSQRSAITHHSTGMEVFNTVTHRSTQRSVITHRSTGMEVSALITGASGQPSLTTLQVWKCMYGVNHHSPLYRYGSVYTHHRGKRSTITHHSTGMEVFTLTIGASVQPSLTSLQWRRL